VATEVTVLTKEVIQPFLVDPLATYAYYDYKDVDAGLWYNGTTYLLLVVNMASTEIYVPWKDIGLTRITNGTTQVKQVYPSLQNTNATGLNLKSGDIGIYTATP
jgi:hypothetical protein